MMRIPLKALSLSVALVALTASCAGSEDKEKPPGRGVGEVCQSFAASGESASALKEIAGDGRLKDDGSDPSGVLKALRSADGVVEGAELLGTPYCKLKSATNEAHILEITFREALAVDDSDAEDKKHFTYYRSGKTALVSDRLASIYFQCKLKDSSKSFIINGTLERTNKINVPPKEVAANQILLLNSSASKVSGELGCQNSQLAKGAPQPLSH
ncbi:hypothetical protein [Streptomyces sp. H27-D2]|uniref:hypothetical protein n=1 Tax=Streptomyces sp. H27-D2 TaxID=3046304 RepID=UPI002DBB7496|nr:hypothetical protein [Streptomyces sp. H27-D2]MEC4019176.1 hypothetical protein [Streptomyces sp. H27-D2]